MGDLREDSRECKSGKNDCLPIKNILSLSGNSIGERTTKEAKYYGILLMLNELISSDNVCKITVFLRCSKMFHSYQWQSC